MQDHPDTATHDHEHQPCDPSQCALCGQHHGPEEVTAWVLTLTGENGAEVTLWASAEDAERAAEDAERAAEVDHVDISPQPVRNRYEPTGPRVTVEEFEPDSAPMVEDAATLVVDGRRLRFVRYSTDSMSGADLTDADTGEPVEVDDETGAAIEATLDRLTDRYAARYAAHVRPAIDSAIRATVEEVTR